MRTITSATCTLLEIRLTFTFSPDLFSFFRFSPSATFPPDHKQILILLSGFHLLQLPWKWLQQRLGHCRRDKLTWGEIVSLWNFDAKKTVQCYQCNSADEEGGCSDTITGELSRCGPGDKGCFISRGRWSLATTQSFIRGQDTWSDNLQQRMDLTWRLREVVLSCRMRASTSVRRSKAIMEVILD